MGIKNLLKFVHGACRRAHVSEFAGKTIGIDMSCLIYRGLYNKKYIKYIRLYIKRLLRQKCKLKLVFDGKAPEAKAAEIEARARLRTSTIEREISKERENQLPTSSSSSSRIQRMCITKEIIAKVKRKFGSLPNVQIIQAPGESDPQLAFLIRQRLIHAIVTDDTDLIVYGCKRIIFKLTPRGQCLIYEKSKLDPKIEWPVFRWACILAGCDYLRGGFRGLGLKKAMIFCRSAMKEGATENESLQTLLDRLPNTDNTFRELFMKAEHTFKHQNIYDPIEKRIKPLIPLPDLPNVEHMDVTEKLGDLQLTESVDQPIVNASDERQVREETSG